MVHRSLFGTGYYRTIYLNILHLIMFVLPNDKAFGIYCNWHIIQKHVNIILEHRNVWLCTSTENVACVGSSGMTQYECNPDSSRLVQSSMEHQRQVSLAVRQHPKREVKRERERVLFYEHAPLQLLCRLAQHP